MNANIPEIEFEDKRLRELIASLTAELAEMTQDRDHALRLANEDREEKAALAAALASIITIRDEALANSEDPDAEVRFGYDGDKTGYLRWGYKFELRDAFTSLSDPFAILASVRAKARAEGMRKAATWLLANHPLAGESYSGLQRLADAEEAGESHAAD